MKKINFVKFALDIVLGIVFALLFNKNVLGGISFHEIAGLAIGFGVLMHILLNWQWVKKATLSIFNNKLGIKTRIGYVLNILLLLDMAIIIISGIFISKKLFPSFRIQSSFFNQSSHIAASYIALALIGIHVGLHWKWAMLMFKKVCKIEKESKTFTYIARALAVMVLGFGISMMISVNFFEKTTQLFGAGEGIRFEQKGGARPDFQFQQQPNNSGFDNLSNNYVDNRQNTPLNNIPNNVPNVAKDRSQKLRDSKGGKNGFPEGERGINGGREGLDGKGKESASIPGLLIENLSIMGVFVVATYYIEKIITRKKKTA